MPELNEAQLAAIYLSHHEQVKEVHMVTGVGVGKTYTLGAWSLPFIAVPGSRGLICSPTVPMMRNSTLPGIETAWQTFGGLRPEVDYVINRRMKGVPAYSGIGSDQVITFRWGSYAVLTSLENYNTVNGSQWDWIVVDECRDVRNFKEALGKLKARMRGERFKKLGMKHRILTATTPPDNPHYFIELQKTQGDDRRVITATSYMNEANLPPDYIQGLVDTYDELTLRREVYGELIIATGMRWAYCFDKDLHVGECFPVQKDHVYLSFDFNISPLTCIAAQWTPDKRSIRVLHEFHLINADISQMAVAIKSWLKTTFGDSHTGRLIVTGDASGKSGTALQVGDSMWNRLIGDLNLRPSQIKIPNANPAHMDSIQLTNSILAKHGDILFSPQTVHLQEDMEFVQRNEKCNPVSADPMKGHLLDCLRYLLWTFHYDFLRKFAKDNRSHLPPVPNHYDKAPIWPV